VHRAEPEVQEDQPLVELDLLVVQDLLQLIYLQQVEQVVLVDQVDQLE
jgi:hypothetical protein